MTNTHFANPNGLDDADHYSTAADIARLAAACMDNELVAKVVSCKTAAVGGRTFTNHNKLLNLYPDCVGMKTGYTSTSGRTLVSAARREGQLLLCVTLNDPNDWKDHAALFDYSFETYPLHLLARRNRTVGVVETEGALVPAVPVGTADDVWYPLAEGEEVRAQLELPESLSAPMEEDVPVGALRFYLGDTLIGESRLVCGASVRSDLAPEAGPLERLWSLLPWAGSA